MTSLYLAYLLTCGVITVLVGQTLFRHGRVFLIDVFHGEKHTADAVNRMLLIGFYLLNIAFATLTLSTRELITSPAAMLEIFCGKIGLVLTVLGVAHCFNVAVLSAIRGWWHSRVPMDIVEFDGEGSV